MEEVQLERLLVRKSGSAPKGGARGEEGGHAGPTWAREPVPIGWPVSREPDKRLPLHTGVRSYLEKSVCKRDRRLFLAEERQLISVDRMRNEEPLAG